jgi:curved DNA-binding protein
VDYKDYYKTLGVSKNASEKDIKTAYRRLARKHHPDVNPGDRGSEVRFKEINEAYAVLSDSEKRQKYDRLGANWQQYERVAQQGGGGFPPGFEGFHVEFEGEPGAERFGGFSDFFKIFFGGGFDPDSIFGGAGRSAGSAGSRRRGRRGRPSGVGGVGFDPPPARGRDVSARLEITLEEAFRGSQKRLALQSTPGSPQQQIEVKIPAGVRDGSKVRVAGKGEPGAGGSPPGDLYLDVKLLPHPIYRREGDDLYVDVPVTVTEAALGAAVEVPTFSGKTRIKVPAGSQSGRLLRLGGKGMPHLKKKSHGDLFARVKVVIPTKLSDKERQLLEELSSLRAENPRAHFGG